MSDDEETQDKKEAERRLWITTLRHKASPTSEMLFINESSEELAGSVVRKMIDEGHLVGPLLEIPKHARGMLEAMLMLALTGSVKPARGFTHEGGPPMFAAVYERQDGGFTAELLTERPRLFGFDVLVGMAGDTSDPSNSPGEALQRLGHGLDAVLSLRGWREHREAPPEHKIERVAKIKDPPSGVGG